MSKQDLDEAQLKEQLVEAQAQIEALQSAAADATARASTARAELAEAATARDSARGELTQLQAELTEVRSQLREATVKYREMRLATVPEMPAELVPATESLEDIDRGFEAAQRVLSQVREKMQEEQKPSRVPVGAPQRRAPDLSGLSAAEKIRLGLQERG